MTASFLHFPLCFTQLLGQEKAKKLVSRSLKAGRIPHAYIFRGPEGVGKRLFARGVAAAVNCRNTDQFGACGSCSSCRKFRSRSHPDYLEVRPEKGGLKIAQIRQLTRELSYPPYESKMRVVVLEDVQSMRREAANALLKTLEEPPENNLLILTADSAQEILATLTSRCQVIPFSPLSLQDTEAILVQQGADPGNANILARLAEGSPGQALLYQKTEMVEFWYRLVKFLSDPSVNRDRDVVKLLDFAEEMAAQKEELPALLGLLKIWIRDLLLKDRGYGQAKSPGTAGGRKWSSDDLFRILHAVNRAEKELQRNCNRSLVCEVLLFKIEGPATIAAGR